MKERDYNPDITNIKETKEYLRQQEAQKAIEQSQRTRWGRIKDFFSNSRMRFATGIALVIVGILLLVAFLSFFFSAGAKDQNRVANYTVIENAQEPEQIHNAVAAVGATVSDWLIADGVGIAAIVVVVWCFTIGMRLVMRRKTHFFTYTFVSLVSIVAWAMLVGAIDYLVKPNLFFPLGGYLGYYVSKWLVGLLGITGLIGVNVMVMVLWAMLTYTTLRKLYEKARNGLMRHHKSDEQQVVIDQGLSEFIGDGKKKESVQQGREKKTRKATDGSQSPETANNGQAVAMQSIRVTNQITNTSDPTGEYAHYQFPPLELLDDVKMNPNSVDAQEQDENKQRIKETLSKYGIEIKEINVHVGPTVTLFEIVPADGVRVNKIRVLEDDIALSLAALGIRIIAPMPGKGTIGIEVPNRDPQVVPMREVLRSETFQKSKAKLPMCLGCTVTNEVFVADLTKMPHLLVAGATGKGKSVGLNAIITSLLYKKGPSELKFVLIDPKRVEFSVYADLEKYFFAKAPGGDRAIVTDTNKVVDTLNCLVQEMEDRYRLLEEVKLRDIASYNELWRKELRDIRDENGDKKYKYLPYIVGIIDEFSDMIMTSGKEVETPLVRIAQKARAVGIHMIIATQRPSAKVITGLIKGNFPGRIAYAVAQRVDSQIILDRTGAQQLIGRGDMLFSIDGEITRLQCPFVDTQEIVRICNFIKQQEDNDRDINHEHPYILPEYVANNDGSGETNMGNVKDRDPLFEEAVKFIVQSNTASTSSLQRRFEIGYNRAGRLIDQMEAAGIVGPANGSKPRAVLVSSMDIDQLFV